MELFLTSVLAFASTNIDDVFMLALFFSDKKLQPVAIYLGQYLGIILLIAVSVAGALLGSFMDSRYIGLLGLFPIYLGVRQVFLLFTSQNKNMETAKELKFHQAGWLSVALITFANGGDNIGVYIPLFTTRTGSETGVIIGIFLMMVLVWLKVAAYLAKHPVAARRLSKYGHIITPLVLIILGLIILNEHASFSLLQHQNDQVIR